VSLKKFQKKYDSKDKPVVITDALQDWPGFRFWNIERLYQRFHNEKFKVGETDSGDTVYMSLKEYKSYLETDAKNDDSPLYIFDSLFADRKKGNTADKIKRKEEKFMDESMGTENEKVDGDRPERFLKRKFEEKTDSNKAKDESSPKKSKKLKKKKLSQSLQHLTPPDSPSHPNPLPPSQPLFFISLEYSIPTYFQEDLFAYGGESSRPPYRWFVMGPARSGTYIHTDPLGTSAWNALISGRKRFVYFFFTWKQNDTSLDVNLKCKMGIVSTRNG
jgi:histone arginine demethylase JMJD6